MNIFSWQSLVLRAKNLSSKKKELRNKMREAVEEDRDLNLMRALKHEKAHSEELDEIVEDVSAQLDRHQPFQMDKLLDEPTDYKKALENFKNTKRYKKDPITKLSGLIRDGVKIAYDMAGMNTTDFDKRLLRFSSPRFLSVMPENNDTVSQEKDFFGNEFHLFNKLMNTQTCWDHVLYGYYTLRDKKREPLTTRAVPY